MDFLTPIVIPLLTTYAGVCGLAGPDAPLWLRWPMPIWNWIAHDWRRPAGASARPDHAKIARLERELGMGDQRS